MLLWCYDDYVVLLLSMTPGLHVTCDAMPTTVLSSLCWVNVAMTTILICGVMMTVLLWSWFVITPMLHVVRYVAWAVVLMLLWCYDDCVVMILICDDSYVARCVLCYASRCVEFIVVTTVTLWWRWCSCCVDVMMTPIIHVGLCVMLC